MPTFRATITQTKYGYIEIEADTYDDAYDAACGIYTEDVEWDDVTSDDYEIAYVVEL